MGLPTISYHNFLNETGVVVTARTQNSTYPASNILKPNVTHLYRSNSKCVVLDGATKYFWIADAAWNSYTGDFCFEFWFRPNAHDVSGRVIDKWGAAGQRAYCVLQVNDDLRVLFSSNGTDTAATVTFNDVLYGGRYDHFKLCYTAAGANIGLYKNGIESGRVINTTPSGTASITGAVPTSLRDGTTALAIGADNAGASPLAGKLGFVGLDNAPNDNGGYLQPSLCDAYYDFDNSDGSDSSGNGRTLTAVSLSSGDYVNNAAYQWIGFLLPATQNPTFLFLDRRHNLTSTATVKLLRSGWYGSYNLIASESVTAGKPVAARFSTTANQYWWLEINDPANTDGYIEIPHVWLGQWQALAQSFGDEGGYLRRAVVAGRGATSTILTRVGSRIGPVVYEFELPWKFKDPDRAIWEAAMAYAATDPIVLALNRDDLDDTTYLVDWLGVHLGSMQGRGELVLRKRTDSGDALSETTMVFSEVGAGVDQ